MSPRDQWEPIDKYLEQWDHPLWKKQLAAAAGAGLNAGEPLDIDCYDGASWSAMSELSERSVANNGRPESVPDFTRGAWMNRAPLGIVAS